MKVVTPRRQIVVSLERLPKGYDVPRHRHFEAYATIILKGSYEQLSYAGRLRPQPGDVLIQPTFDSHANRMLSRGIELIRLPWRREIGLGGVYRGCKIDQIRKVAAHDIWSVNLNSFAVVVVRRTNASRLMAQFEQWRDCERHGEGGSVP